MLKTAYKVLIVGAVIYALYWVLATAIAVGYLVGSNYATR